MNDPLVLMTFAFLLPLVPAYILYRTLPSDTKVGGPFKGLNLQLSGSFAGYFLLTVMAFAFIKSSIPKTPVDDMWEVRGRIHCQNGIDVNQLRVHVVPPNYDLPTYALPDGQLLLRVPAKLDPSGKPKFPTLMIDGPGEGIENLTIDLNESNKTGQDWKLDTNRDSKAISVLNIPTLKRKTLYEPTAGAPDLVPQPKGSEVAP
jgi:hypothetical protein